MRDQTWLIPDWNCELCGSLEHETTECPLYDLQNETAECGQCGYVVQYVESNNGVQLSDNYLHNGSYVKNCPECGTPLQAGARHNRKLGPLVYYDGSGAGKGEITCTKI